MRPSSSGTSAPSASPSDCAGYQLGRPAPGIDRQVSPQAGSQGRGSGTGNGRVLGWAIEVSGTLAAMLGEPGADVRCHEYRIYRATSAPLTQSQNRRSEGASESTFMQERVSKCRLPDTSPER